MRSLRYLIRQCTDVGSEEHSSDLPPTCPGFMQKIKIEKRIFCVFEEKIETGRNIVILTTKLKILLRVWVTRRSFGLDIGFIDHFNTQLVITLNYSTITLSV
jgi:hypothetical protein